jgi:two-component system, OmpR family, phosphate regulon sensor histidine kinase PhoR
LHIAVALHNFLQTLQPSNTIQDIVLKITRHWTTLKSLTAILILLVLLPAVFFSAYEISSLSQSEKLIESLYRRQLDAALFSVNQFAWDIADSWARDVNRMLQSNPPSLTRTSSDLDTFLATNRGIRALFVADTASTTILLAATGHRDSTSVRVNLNDFLNLVRSEQRLVTRLSELDRTGYRKIEGVTLHTAQGESSAGLLFMVDGIADRKYVAGIVLNAESFVRHALRQKLDETAASEFILSVVSKSGSRQVYATGPLAPGEERQTKDLWLFPDYTLGIRMQGQTIEELVRERFFRNLTLLVILDFMILVGAWFLFRTVRREMQLARMQSDFVSNVSHELRTPLSLIRMFGETLEMGRVQSEEKKQEYYSTIVRETERLTGLINNVLSFSRMESGKKAYQLNRVDLNSVVKQVLESYQSHLNYLGFTVQVELAEQLPSIMADAEAVSEALLNIVDNSLKYGHGQKWMKISTGKRDGSVFVAVEDHGIGIAAEDQTKIFEKFYRVPSELAQQTRGSGLGLTLVRHIMDAHSGHVTVKSRIGQGSTFQLSFPFIA